MNKHKSIRIKLIALVTAFFTALTIPCTAYALESPLDTVWGSIPASAYMGAAFYKEGNSFKFPISYLEDMEEGKSYPDKVSRIYAEAYKQSAYLFIADYISYTYSESWDYVLVNRYPVLSADKERNMMNVLENEANRIISEIIKPNMSDYDKAVTIYNYVRKAAIYDWDAYYAIIDANWQNRKSEFVMGTSAYGCLILGKSVCQGYAHAYNLLARKAGLTSIMASGTVGDNQHAWNRVWADGRWYEVDATYNGFYKTFAEYQADIGATGYNNNTLLESSMSNYYS